MTSKADRRAISRAVAKAIAYHDCSKPEKAAVLGGPRSCGSWKRKRSTTTARASRPE